MICMKRSIAVVALALAMIACAVVVTDESDALTTDDGFEYTSSQGIAAITGYTGDDSVITIPETIDSSPVQAINDRAFVGSTITEVIISASITSIGEYAFSSCNELEYVFIEGSTTIGKYAFDGCANLKFIDFADKPNSIGENAFNLKSTHACTYRSADDLSLDSYGGGSTFERIGPEVKLVRFQPIGQVPDELPDLDYVLKNIGDKVEIPEAAVFHGYDIATLNGEEVLDLETFTVSDDIIVTLSYTYSLFDVIFYVDDEVYEPYQLRYNDVITLPEPPTKETDAQFSYKFKEWSGYTEGMTVTGDMRFDAVFDTTLQTYTVQFVSDGQIVQSKVMGYGETIVPPEDPVRNTEDGIDYRFTGWGGYSSGMTVTGDITFDAVFIESDHEYTIKFVVDGVTVKEDKLLFEEAIVPPEDPVKENANGIKFTFAGWEGYTEGMTVTDDMTFTATFTESPVEEGSSNTWIIVVVVVIVVVFVGLFLFRKFH